VRIAQADSTVVAPVQRLVRSGSAHTVVPVPDDCLGDVRYRRYLLDEVERTGEGKTVVVAWGDHLSNWPPGFDGLYWGRWRAECTVLVGSDPVDCSVTPLFAGDPAVMERVRRRVPRRTDDPQAEARAVTLVVRSINAFQTDTLQFTVDRIAALAELPTRNPGKARCTRSGSLTAFSSWTPEGHQVARIELTGVDFRPWSVDLMRVVERGAGGRDIMTECGETTDQPYVITSLDGVGPALPKEVWACEDTNCHEGASVPVHQPLPIAFRFRLGDVRHEALIPGETIHVQIETDARDADLMAFAVSDFGGRLRSEPFRPTSVPWRFRLPVGTSFPFDPDVEVRLYLLRR
jgi:hypothetical protein